MTRLTVTFLLLLLIAAPVGAQSQPKRILAPEARIEQRLNAQVPLDLTFRDEAGHERPLRDFMLPDKPAVLVLAYYRCPKLCSLVLNGVSDGLRPVAYEMGKDYAVVTVSIDPREKPELAVRKKQAHVDAFGRSGAEAGWHFLTGDEEQIKQLAEAVGYGYRYDAERDEYAHASGIMLLTPDGRVSRYFYGIEYRPRDLSFGLEDASEGMIGSAVTRPLRLLCYGYDPVDGTYTVMTLRLVRVAAVLTVVALGGFLFIAWRRERRRAAPVAR